MIKQLIDKDIDIGSLKLINVNKYVYETNARILQIFNPKFRNHDPRLN